MSIRGIFRLQFWAITALLLCYALLYYLQFTQSIKLDFSSFYATATALSEGLNPYKNLALEALHSTQKLPANLNPPIFLYLMQPLTWLAYPKAVVLWAIVLLIFNLAGAWLTAESALSCTRHKLMFIAVYFALFSTLMGTAIAQMGAVILFFVMAGYICYRARSDRLAGVLWGVITALKCFPGLLILLALKQQRLRVAWYFAMTVGLLWFIPFAISGKVIYQQYAHMLNYVLWYGDSWNGSLYGFLFRLLGDASDISQSLLLVRGLYFLLALFAILWLWNQIQATNNRKDTDTAFSLCLVMMLILSPFGWLYYFSLLSFALLISWQRLFNFQAQSTRGWGLWLICLLLLNMPLDYVMASKMSGWIRPLTLFSTYFYGLVLLGLVVFKSRNLEGNTQEALQFSQRQHLTLPLIFSLLMGVAVPVGFYLHRLMSLAD